MIVRTLLVLLVGSACTAVAPQWRECPQAPQAECATVSVPVDWDRPEGRSIALDLVRLKATDPSRRSGVVLFNPGGPGASGVSALTRAAPALAGLRSRFDVVSWNPRGTVLAKSPSCVDGPESGAPESAAEYDMDRIREALGERKIAYFGQSYGGVFGVTYARLFPHRVHAMALDGIINHTADNAALEAMMRRTLQHAFAEFTARHPRQGAAWRDLLIRAGQDPIPVKQLSYNAFDLQNAAYGMLIDNARHADLAAAIDQALKGDATLFAARAGRRKYWTPSFGLATQCADGFRYSGYDDYAASAARERRAAPDFPTFRTGYQASTCVGFPGPVRNPRGPLDGSRLPPLLGVSGLVNQPETEDVVRRVPGSAMVPVQRREHVLYQKDSAVRERVDGYFS